MDEIPGVVHLGTFRVGHKGPGTYQGGIFKIRGNAEEDLLGSAQSFLEAADRCLNGNKVEDGIKMLLVPGVVCAALACELFLKFVVLKETGQAAKGHQLSELLAALSADAQAELLKLAPDIGSVLERNAKHFVDGRYHHELDQFSFRQTELLQAAEQLSAFVSARFRP